MKRPVDGPPLHTRAREFSALLTDALASRQPSSFALWVCLTAALTLRVLIGDTVWKPLELITSLPELLVATAAIGLIALVSRQLWRAAFKTRRSRIVLNIVTVTAIVVALAISRELTAPLELSAVIGRGLMGSIYVLLIIVILNERDIWSQTAQSLSTEQQQLGFIRAQRAQSLENIRTQVVTTTKEHVDAELAACSRELNSISASPINSTDLHRVAAQLRACSVDVVRDLSHSLDEPPQRWSAVDLPQAPIDSPTEQVSFGEIIDDSSSHHPLNPPLVFVLLLSSSTSVAGLFKGWQGVVTATVYSVGVGIILTVFNHLMKRFIGSMRLGARLALIASCVVIAVLASVAVTQLIRQPELSLTRFAISGMFGALVMTAIVAVGLGIVRARQRYLAELQATNQSLEDEITHVHSAEIRIRREVSQLLHGDIQGRLAAAALQLDALADQVDSDAIGASSQAATDRVQLCVDAVADAVERLKSLSSVNADAVAHGTGFDYSELPVEWAGIIDITIETSPEALDLIGGMPELDFAITQILKDAIGNSVRHGHAKSLAVSITADELQLELTACDDGIGMPQAKADDGLGTRTVSRYATSVVRSNREGGGTELRATLRAVPATIDG